MSIWHKTPTIDVLNHDFGSTAATHMGIEFTAVGDDYLVARMPVDDTTRQPYGILHGGASCLLAETIGSLGGALCLDPDREYPVGLEINANHVRAVASGHVHGTGRPLHLGRSTQVWEIVIRDDDGDTVCLSRLTLLIKSRRQKLLTSGPR